MSYKIMRYKHLGLAAVLVSTTMLNAGYALAAGGHGPSPTTTMLRSTAAATSTIQAKTGEQNQVTSKEGWLIAERELWLPVVDQLDQHLMTARLDFMNKDNPNAAMEIRQGAEFLQQEEQGPGSPTDIEARAAAAADLTKLANQVEQGKVTSVDELNKAFVQAYQVDIEHRLVHLKAEELFPLTEKPAMHFHRATEAFKAKDATTAATEIHKALAFLKIEEAATSGPAKATLQAAIDRLETLAVEAAAGNVLAEAELDQAFLRAYHALGQHHYLEATAALDQKDMREAGYELRAATRYLEQAQAEMKQPTTASHDALRDLADKLIASKYPGADEAQPFINQIGQELEQLGRAIGKMSPQANTPPATDEWVVAEEKVTIPVLDGLGQHLQAASHSFANKDTKLAAQEIRAAATFLNVEAAKLTNTADQQALKAAMGELDKLAAAVEQGQVTSIEALNTVFTAAHQADVEHRLSLLKAEELAPFVEKPAIHFQRALTALEKKENNLAAQEIRKGVAFMRIAEGRASGPTLTALQRSAEELADLAMQVANKQVTSITDLKKAFGRAHHTLASYHQTRAVTARANNNLKEMGYELQAAANHLEQALSHAGSRIEEGNATLVKDLRALADQLIAGNQVEPKQISQVLENMGKKLEALGVELDILAAAK